MMYKSTRGNMQPQPFSEILLEGLAPDGGLAIPEVIPRVSSNQLEAWRELNYAQLAFEIIGLFATDIPSKDLQRITSAAYSVQNFNDPGIVPLKPLGSSMALLGLSQGPTLAFKDMAMQFLGHMFEYVLNKRNATINILGATSGDTGSAAEYALRGKQGVNVFMLSPQGRMSSFQRAQMYSLQDPNIHNIAVNGVFDDCQDIVKHLSADLAFKEKYNIGAVNSINWGRIAAQIVYYFWGWLRATTSPDQQVSFAVPTGNFGNILAGHFAREMGLPIKKLVLATNENNVLEEFFTTGIYRPRSSDQTHATSSPSMDISKASNFERFVYYLLNQNADSVRVMWSTLEKEGFFNLSHLLPVFEERFGFVAGASTNNDRLNTIKTLYETANVLIDPHTADGVHVAKNHVEPGVPMLILETALPAKFAEFIQEAVGIEPPVPEHLQSLHSLPQRVVNMEFDAEQVREYIIKNA